MSIYLLLVTHLWEKIAKPKYSLSRVNPVEKEHNHTGLYTPRVYWSTLDVSSMSTPTSVTWSSARDRYPNPAVPRPPFGKVLRVTENVGGCAKSNFFGKTMMKLLSFDSTESWIDYKAHFEACCSIHAIDRNNRQKSGYSAASLRGQAQMVLGNMNIDNACGTA